MIKWIRYRYQIPKARLERPEELTVQYGGSSLASRTGQGGLFDFLAERRHLLREDCPRVLTGAA